MQWEKQHKPNKYDENESFLRVRMCVRVGALAQPDHQFIQITDLTKLLEEFRK